MASSSFQAPHKEHASFSVQNGSCSAREQQAARLKCKLLTSDAWINNACKKKGLDLN